MSIIPPRSQTQSNSDATDADSPGRVESVATAVDRDHPLPPELENVSREAQYLHYQNRQQEILARNACVRVRVEEQTARLRRAVVPGQNVVCPDCEEEQSYGGILHHRRKLCSCKRV